MRIISFAPNAVSEHTWTNFFWNLQNEGTVVRVRCTPESPAWPGESFDCKVRGVEGNAVSVRKWDRIMNTYIGGSAYVDIERIHVY